MLAGVPVLFRPRIISLKNRWLHSSHGVLKEVMALIISTAMMVGIYLSTLTALRESALVSTLSSLGISPTVPFSILLSGIFSMLFLSAVVSAFSTLFMSRDLEIAFSAPVSRSQLLLFTCTEVGYASAWIVTTIGLPSLLACGAYSEAGLLYYLVAPILFAILYVPVILAAVITALLIALILPASRGQRLAVALCLTALAAIAWHLNGANSSADAFSLESRATLISALSVFTRNEWIPTVLFAQAIHDLLHGSFVTVAVAMTQYVLAAALLWLILHGVYTFGYHRAFTTAHAQHRPYKIHSRSAQQLARLLFPLARSTTRAVATKEFKVFSRDITHTVQVVMLLGICFIYLYTFKRLKDPAGLSTEAKAIWDTLLLLGNVVMSSFVVISICSRFVFPSVSIEGAGFWIIQSSPISFGELLRAKIKGWLLPVSLISSVIFASGAMALDADGSLVIASLVAGLIISYGFVGVSVGLGALFAKFDCDHSTQVSTSLGGLVLVGACLVLLLGDVIPLAFTFGSHILFPADLPSFKVELIEIYIPLAVLLAINITVTALAIRIGRRALRNP
jgi:ABC-2 type transport system permease protein